MDPVLILLLATLMKVAAATFAIGWIPALIARSKGRRFLPWWIYGGALFLVALIHSLLLKPWHRVSATAAKVLQAVGDKKLTLSEIMSAVDEDRGVSCRVDPL